MVVFLWVIGAAMIAGLMLFMAYASTVGGLGILTRSSFERCPRCGRHGLVHTGLLQGGVCPPSTAGRIGRVVHDGYDRVHLGHH